MKVKAIELFHLDVPFTDLTDKQMKYWLPHFRIVQICKLTVDNGVVGWGESAGGYLRPHRRPRGRPPVVAGRPAIRQTLRRSHEPGHRAAAGDQGPPMTSEETWPPQEKTLKIDDLSAMR